MTLSIAEFIDPNKNSDLESLKSLGIEQVERVWNSLQVKGLNGLTERDKLVKNKCIEVLESGYRKPWDENIYFKMIQMRLDAAENEIVFNNRMNVLNQIKKIKNLLSEMEVSCPFLPKSQLKRSLELKGKFAVLKLKDGIINERINLDQNITEIIELLVEHKKKGFNIAVFGSNLLNLLKEQENSFIPGKSLESLIPECEEFKEFHVDLLNILTELVLNLAIECKKTVKFSEYVTEAINFNVRSLNLRSNVMGYFEFLKLTKLQGKSEDFDDAIETCLISLKNRISPDEDIKGKLQIIRLIVNETKNLKKGIDFASELFINCDFKNTGAMIFEEMLCLIEETSSGNSNMFTGLIEGFLERFTDQLRTSTTCQQSVIETLLRLAEKNWTIKRDYKRTEEMLKIIQSLNVDSSTNSEEIKVKISKCYLKLDKLTEAKELISSNDDPLVLLEFYLRSQDEFNAMECIEELLKDPNCKYEQFLNIYNLLKTRLSPEMKMKLLKSAQLKNQSSDSGLKIDIIRGIISLLYDCIIELGFTPDYTDEFERNLTELKEATIKMTANQIVWVCQVCWNLGVIHARAEDFKNAQIGFKWCQEFSKQCEETQKEFSFKAAFYYLTAKLCTEEAIDEEFDYEILSNLETSSNDYDSSRDSVDCLKVEMYLRSKKWERLIELLKSVSISFVTLAEIVLRTSEEVPLEIYRLILEKLSEDEFNSADFDIERFSGLYRGLTTCSLLQFPNDMSHFYSALKMIKSSFGKYPGDEIVWLCGTAFEMGRQSAEIGGDWNVAGQWTEIALNLVYLIPSEDERLRILKQSLQESVKIKKIKYALYSFSV